MNDPKIVASSRDRGRRASAQVEGPLAWAVLGWIGLAFLVVGGSDFALTWFPLDLGNPEWKFGTVTASFNGLPILMLGVGFLVVASQELGRRWWGTLGLSVGVVLAVWILVGLALWSGTVSLALQTVPDELRTGVRRAVAKTLLQSVCFEAFLVYLIWRATVGWRRVDEQGEAV